MVRRLKLHFHDLLHIAETRVQFPLSTGSVLHWAVAGEMVLEKEHQQFFVNYGISA